MARWVGLPVLAFALAWVAIFSLPGNDCDGYPDDAGLAGIALVVLTVASTLGCLAGGVLRINALRSGPGISTAERNAALGVVPILALLALLVTPWEVDAGFVWLLFLLGACATAVALLALVVASIAGRRPDDVGLLLPSFLLGAAVFVYPGLALIALLLSSGIAC